MARRLTSALGYVWASPATIVGFIVVLLLRFCGIVTPIGWYGGAHFHKFTSSMPKWAFKRYYSHPLVIGHVAVIYTRKRDDVYRDVMMLHAIAHVRQWTTFGLFTPLVRSSVSLLLRLLPNVDNFYDDPFEIDARRFANQTVDIPRLKKRVMSLIRGSQLR